MATWLLALSELTPDQARAVRMDPAEHRIIFGGPGSGKTQVLLHRAKFLRERWNVAADRFRILVFTNVLKHYIRSALDLLDLPEDSVMTFDHWCRLFYEEHVSRRVPWDPVSKQPDFAATRRGVLNALTGNGREPLYDFVLVDEGQDLTEEAFAILTRVAVHVTVCMDHKQQIYDEGTNESGILARLGLRRRNATLLDAFRCSPYIVRTAATLIDDIEERHIFVNQARTAQIARETLLLYKAKSFDDERDRLIEILRVRLARNERIAVLFPQYRQVAGFGLWLREAGLDVEIQSKRRAGESEMDFTNLKPKLLTYHSAKGLTFDTVLMPRLVADGFPSVPAARLKRLLFVGLTRAVNWAYVSTIEGKELPLLRNIEAQSGGSITAQHWTDRVAPQPLPRAGGESAPDLTDLF